MQKSALYLTVIIFGLASITSCKKSSDDSSNDPCEGISPVVASAIAAPPSDTFRLYASTVTGATYAWTGPNNFTSLSQNPIVPNVNTAKNGMYTVLASVSGCTRESSVNVSTFSFSTPPCSPALNSYTSGTMTYNQTVPSYEPFHASGPEFTIETQTAQKFLKLRFNENDIDITTTVNDGVYKVTQQMPVAHGYVLIVIQEASYVYSGTTGFVCVQNYLDANQVAHGKFTWCDVNMKQTAGTSTFSSTGFTDYSY